MNITVERASYADRDVVRRMMELYLHDFSEFDGSDLNEHGLFGYDYLDYFWLEESHAAFIIRVAGHLAGFVLVNDELFIENNERSIAEFFIVRKYRRQGIGKVVAQRVFDAMPGKWEVQVIEANRPAYDFWRKIIAEYTGGRFQERALANEKWTGPVFWFENHAG